MLMENLSIIVRQMRIFSERRLLDLNIGFPEQMVLMFLSSYENVNQEQIAKHFEIDKGAIAKTIKKLEEKKLVIRVENKDNKREKILHLSESAKEVTKKMQSILDEWNTCIYKGVSDEDVQKFKQITDIMAANSIELTNQNRG